MNPFSARVAKAKWFYEVEKTLDWMGVKYKHGYKKLVIELPKMAKLNEKGEVK